MRQVEAAALSAGLGAGAPYAKLRVEVAAPQNASEMRLALVSSAPVGSADALAGKLAWLVANKPVLEKLVHADVLDQPAPALTVASSVSPCIASRPEGPRPAASTARSHVVNITISSPSREVTG